MLCLSRMGTKWLNDESFAAKQASSRDDRQARRGGHEKREGDQDLHFAREVRVYEEVAVS